MLLMSATFSESTLADALQVLQKTHCQPELKKLVASSGKKNIELSVVMKKGGIDLAQEILRVIEEKVNGGAAIIFCYTVRKCHTMQNWLAACGVNSLIYYADLDETEKRNNLQSWFNNSPSIMCCTSALGMGLDKEDIQLCVHLCMPDSISAYYQQVGRAGRQGQMHAEAILLFDPSRAALYVERALLQAAEKIVKKKMVLDDIVRMQSYCVNSDSVCPQKYFAKTFLPPTDGEVFNKCLENSHTEKNIRVRQEYFAPSVIFLACMLNVMCVASRICPSLPTQEHYFLQSGS